MEQIRTGHVLRRSSKLKPGQKFARNEHGKRVVVDEQHLGFAKLKSKLSHEKGVSNPGALAATIGRKKYGKKKFQAAAAKGHSVKEEKINELSKDLLHRYKKKAEGDWLSADVAYDYAKTREAKHAIVARKTKRAKGMARADRRLKESEDFDKIHRDYHSLKKMDSKALLNHVKSKHRVHSIKSIADLGGKQGAIDHALRADHSQKKIEAYYASGMHKKKLKESTHLSIGHYTGKAIYGHGHQSAVPHVSVPAPKHPTPKFGHSKPTSLWKKFKVLRSKTKEIVGKFKKTEHEPEHHAESTQIDEISHKLARNYIGAALKQNELNNLLKGAPNPGFKEKFGKKSEKRKDGMALALKKIHAKHSHITKTPAKVPATEETQIDELSKKTLTSYSKKAKVDRTIAVDKRSKALDKWHASVKKGSGSKNKDYDDLEKADARVWKRRVGLHLATKKRTAAESTQIDEISKKTLHNYYSKAYTDKHSTYRPKLDGTDTARERVKKFDKKVLKRNIGMSRAAAKLDGKYVKVPATEEIQIDENKKPRAYKVWHRGNKISTEEVVHATHKSEAVWQYAKKRGLKTIHCDAKLHKEVKD